MCSNIIDFRNSLMIPGEHKHGCSSTCSKVAPPNKTEYALSKPTTNPKCTVHDGIKA